MKIHSGSALPAAATGGKTARTASPKVRHIPGGGTEEWLRGRVALVAFYTQPRHCTGAPTPGVVANEPAQARHRRPARAFRSLNHLLPAMKFVQGPMPPPTCPPCVVCGWVCVWEGVRGVLGVWVVEQES